MITERQLANRRVVQTADNIVSDMDGEKVMMNLESGKYYNLGRVGGRIWELIAVPISIGDLIDRLVEEYEVDRSLCEYQVMSFLQSLADESLIIMETDEHGRS
ncbi:hypothetical protein PACILC2_21290 [Paenibacillus cisolokensis]|uniref:Metallophosphoesterase n=1 Tax=Paenibacillus cisolokensis TaxID=1658519 RepID=A0ABQ4N5Y0_9BACL|nr:lasso peptide biosynthesis PqqD family chaperone [Paenibacillus cisolokensis]GIQ63561.1 hypothetical protein PACILC2_21290 [Paenibacillus cisolokensis]